MLSYNNNLILSPYFCTNGTFFWLRYCLYVFSISSLLSITIGPFSYAFFISAFIVIDVLNRFSCFFDMYICPNCINIWYKCDCLETSPTLSFITYILFSKLFSASIYNISLWVYTSCWYLLGMSFCSYNKSTKYCPQFILFFCIFN